jgi:hypothetical protein
VPSKILTILFILVSLLVSQIKVAAAPGHTTTLPLKAHILFGPFLPPQEMEHDEDSLLSRSFMPTEQLFSLLSHTPLGDYAQDFIKAEQVTGVNALALVAICILESGWGSSQIFIEKNNCFGFGAYDDNPSQAVDFDSFSDSILYVAHYIKDEYLMPTGSHYSGTDLKSVNENWASDPLWHKKIDAIWNQLLRQKNAFR